MGTTHSHVFCVPVESVECAEEDTISDCAVAGSNWTNDK